MSKVHSSPRTKNVQKYVVRLCTILSPYFAHGKTKVYHRLGNLLGLLLLREGPSIEKEGLQSLVMGFTAT